MLSILGSYESPAMSAATGATVAQKIPQIMPASIAKRHDLKALRKNPNKEQIVPPQNVT